MEINHRYIDYFFAIYNLAIVICCIFNIFPSIVFYRLILSFSAAELMMRRFMEGLEGRISYE